MTPLPSSPLLSLIIAILWCCHLSSTHHRSAVSASVISQYNTVKVRRSDPGSNIVIERDYPINDPVNGCFLADFRSSSQLVPPVGSGYLVNCILLPDEGYGYDRYQGWLLAFYTSDCTGSQYFSQRNKVGAAVFEGTSFTCHNGAASAPTPVPPSNRIAQCKADYQRYSSTANPSKPCGPYDCLEDIFKCNADPLYRNRYLINYGKKFCNVAYNEMNAKLTSPLSRAWLIGTRKCLQLQLVDNVEPSWSCGQITNFAYNSHVPCYTSSAVNPSGQSICLLPVVDQVTIVWYMKGGLVSSCSAVKQAVDIFKTCKTQVLKYISVKIEVTTGVIVSPKLIDNAINKIYDRLAGKKIKLIGNIISKVAGGASACGTLEELLAGITSNNNNNNAASPTVSQLASHQQRVAASSAEVTTSSSPLPTLDGSFTLTLAVAPDENSTTIDDDIAFLKNDLFNESVSNLTAIISDALLEQSNGSFRVVDVSETRSSEFLDGNSNSQATEDGNVSLGVIIGASGGGFAFISAAAFLVIRYFHNRSKKQDDVSKSSDPMDEVAAKPASPV